MPKTEITGKQVKDESLTSDDIAVGGVRGSDANQGSQREIEQGTVSDVDLRIDSVTAAKVDANDDYTMNTLSLSDGVVGAPSLSFVSNTNTGIYQTSGSLRFSANGVEGLRLSNAGAIVQLAATDGSAAIPTYSFLNDPDTGFYRASSGSTKYSANTVEILQINALGIEMRDTLAVFRSSDGSVTLPGYSFASDNDTGMFRPTTDQLTLVAGGVNQFNLTSTQIRCNPNESLSMGAVGNAFSRFYSGAGTEALPAFAFGSNSNTGMYRVGVNQIGFSANGVRQFTSGTTGLTITTFLNLPNGSAVNPPLRAAADTDTGIFFGSNEIKFATNGVQELLIENTGIVATSSFKMPNGTVGAPGIRFTNSENTGLYRIASENLGITAGGVRAASFTDAGVDLLGTTTNDSASAGDIGELINSNVPRSGPVSTVANTAKTVTSISLTAGDWDITGAIGWRTQGSTTNWRASINTTTNALPSGDKFANFSGGSGAIFHDGISLSSAEDFMISLPPSRVSLSVTTTIYLVQETDFANNAYGYIEARRRR